jgi:uncharacterized protein (TIGR02145 family)
VTIGTQVWLRENLKTTKFNDGTPITNYPKDTSWGSMSPIYCWYNNDSATYKAAYGALYNWYTVNTSKLCPTGWHVPSDEEWKTLEIYLGLSQAEVNNRYRGTSLGGQLKETGTTHWESPNTGATNTSGFTALPGGFCFGPYDGIGHNGLWWSSSDSSTNEARYRQLFQNSGAIVERGLCDKSLAGSVRCLKVN